MSTVELSGHEKGKGQKNCNTVTLPAAYINTVTASGLLQVPIIMNGTQVSFTLDCGAEVNIIDEHTHRSIGQPPIQPCSEQGRFFEGTRCSFIGKGLTTFEFNGIVTKQPF